MRTPSISSEGKVVYPAFSVNLHIREQDLVENLFKYFNCGHITISEKDKKVSFRIRSLTNILDTVIPFFNQWELDGLKFLDFKDWCKVIFLIKNKEHLTENGFKQILEITSKMNSRRLKNTH